MSEDYLCIIDGSSLLTTQFFGNLPREILFAKTTEEKEQYYHKIMQTSKGVYTNAVYGFIRTLLKLIKEQKPKYLAVAWDISRDTFRRELYADYKGNRGETLEPLRDQYLLCQEVLREMKVPQFMDERYEADDFSGTLATAFEDQVPVRILTKDNDYLQLATGRTIIWLMHTTAKKTEELYRKYQINQQEAGAPERSFPFTPELILKEFGVLPQAVNSLKALQGDSSDNIKGVPGVGEASALALIQEYGSVEGLYDAIRGLDDVGRKKMNEYWKEKLGLKRSPMSYLIKESETELVGEKAAFLSKTLATIKKDIDLNGLELKDLSVLIDLNAAAAIFDRLEFKSLALDYEETSQDILGEAKFRYVTAKKEFVEIFNRVAKEDKGIGLAVFFDKQEYEQASIFMDTPCLIGAALTLSANETVMLLTGNEITEEMLKLQIGQICKAGILIFALDLKKQLTLLYCAEENTLFDVSVAAYLLNPLQSQYEYQDISKEYLELRIPSAAELIGKLSLREAYIEKPEAFLKACCYESSVAYHCSSILRQQLQKTGMQQVFDEIEMPLVFTLYDMECRGIRVNREALKEYGSQLSVGIKMLEKEIYEAVGEEFNINSPKQLGVILFEKLKLPYGKKSKTGYSTSADILEKLQAEEPIVSKILEYRQLTKLKSTYADGLAEYIGLDGRIHGKFNQMITATGRISSTEPNLQNIPVRMELGRLIRKVFIPEDGYLFLDADYSQIELRILAHMSGDEKMIEAYRNKQDIHRITASQVFHTPLDEVTSAQRSNAKAVNFGIVYGISSFGLGQDLNISKKEAQEYIEQYFITYPKVKEFLDGLVQEGKDKGFVSTLFGRKRPIPELESSNFMQRSFGERVAMNSPIQGTAADIIKIAMIRVNKKLKQLGLSSRLILQIHDELLIETKDSEAGQVQKILSEEMFHAADLVIPLEIDVNKGYNWYELK